MNIAALQSSARRQFAALSSLFHRLRTTPLRDWPLLEFSVTEASAIYMFAFIVSAILGMVRQIAFNAQFGLSEDAAAYYASFRLPETIGILVSGGALTNALVPLILRAQARGGDAAVFRLINLTLSFLLGSATLLGLLFAFSAPAFVQYILAPGLEPATQALTVSLSRLMLLEVLLVVSESALVSLLVSRNQMLLPALAIMVRNITLISGIVAAIFIPGVGIYGPTIGAILDALFQIVVLVPGLRKRGYKPAIIWAHRDVDLRAMLRLLGPSSLSGLANYAGGIADTAFMSIAGRAAALGALQNAYLLIGLPIRLFGIAIGQAALPQFATYAVNGDKPAMRQALRQTLWFACSVATLIALGMIGLGQPVLAFVFERAAFDSAATQLTANMLSVYAIGLPAYVATEVLTRALVSHFDTRTPLLTNCAQLAARILLISLLLDPVGPLAIPLAFAVSSIAEAFILYIVLKGKI